jgi:3'-5' exoribonuclease
LRAVLVRDFTEGADVEAVLLLRGVERRERRNGGGEFLRLELGDRTGRVTGCVWEGVAEAARHARVATPVKVAGRFERHPRFGPQIAVRSLRPAPPGSFSLEDLLDGPPRPVTVLEADLRELLATIREPHLTRLLDRFFGEGSPAWERFRVAPAAKHFHHAYRHGLLEHCLTVAQGVSAISATFPGIDRDVAVTGALLHDIGKLEAYTTDPLAHDLTDQGRLQGEIPLGYYRVRREIEELPGFPPGLAQAVLHIILSHHGALEHGSPVRPCTREATLVHFLDNLGGRLGSFDRLEKELPEGATWSAFDRALGAGAYFGARGEQVREAA